MQQTVTTTTTKGIVIGLILMVIGIAVFFLDIDVNGPSKWVSSLVFFIGIIWSVYSYGKQIDYNSSFGNYFAHGFKVSAVVTCIMIIYIVFIINFFPEFKEKAIDTTKLAMQKKGTLTQEQITKFGEMMRKSFMVFAIGGTLLTYIIIGAIAALVGAAITKKEPQPLDANFNPTLQ